MHQSEKLTALGQMAGGIAHDFNNLLQAILGYAQLMGKNPANVDVVRRGLDVIEKAATGGAETVRRIQKFARLRPEEAFVGLDLDQVIHDCTGHHAAAMGREEDPKAGLPLELELDLGIGARGDGTPGRAERGGDQSDPERHRRDAERRHPAPPNPRVRMSDNVVFTVNDTGIGMTEEVRRRIFDPFFTTKGEEGTGLGLPVSYSIVKRHGGEMRVESCPGGGTTFTVILPMGDSRGFLTAPAEVEPTPAGRAASFSSTTTHRS